MEVAPMLPPLPAVSVSRDTVSPISDCIIVRDSDSSSVITEDTGITSMASAPLVTGNSKNSSRATSVVNCMSSSDIAPSSVTSASETEDQPAKLAIEKPIELPTRVLRQRPGRPSLSSASTPKKPNPHHNQEEMRQLRSASTNQSKQEEPRDKTTPPDNRRRSKRISLLSAEIKTQSVSKTETPSRDKLKRSHEVMNAGSKSADARLGRAQSTPHTKKPKVQVAVDDSDDSASSSSDSESDEDGSDTDNEDDNTTTSSEKRSVGSARDDEYDSENELKKTRKDKPKKVWLKEGLYVGEKIEMDVRPRTKRGRVSGFGVQKKQPALPLPMHEGLDLLNGHRDFKLPFNIFHVAPFKTHPPNWKALNRNVFVGDAKDLWRATDTEPSGKCFCRPETGCDEHCLNSCVYYECDEENCNVGPEKCQNRPFSALKERVKQKSRFAEGVEIIKTEDRGYGLRATRSFEPNQIIIEYCGEIISQEETDRRLKEVYKNDESYYLMLFDQTMIIDATRGSVARFVNHSCEPNCRMEKWIVDKKPRMALFAGENGIETGTELTYDYNFNWASGVSQQVCRCGSEQCRGAMGKRTDGKNQPVQEKPKPRTYNRITQTKKTVKSSFTSSSKKTITKTTPTANKNRQVYKIVKKTTTKKTVNSVTVKSSVIKTPGRKAAATPIRTPTQVKSQTSKQTTLKPLMSSHFLNKSPHRKTPLKNTYGRATRPARSADKKEQKAKVPVTVQSE